MLTLTALLAACLPALALADVYSLSDLSWTLRNGNGSIVIPAKVPSQAHLDLLAAGIIEEPLLEQNGVFFLHQRARLIAGVTGGVVMQSTTTGGLSMTAGPTPLNSRPSYKLFPKIPNRRRYLSSMDWTPSQTSCVHRHLALSDQMLSSSQTIAGHPVAWVDNQFRQYVYDVTDLISSPSETDNNITVAFESAYLYGLNVTSITYENPLTSDVSTSFCHTNGRAERLAVRVRRLPAVPP